MEPIVIDTNYFKITENSNPELGTYYLIYPFDAFGNMYKRIQIDVDIKEWNQQTIIIYVPEISTLNYIFDLKISVTNYTQVFEFPSPPVVSMGNNTDMWTFDGAIYGSGSLVWTPQSYNPAPSSGTTYPYGSWCVVPQYQGGLGLAGVSSRTLDSADAITPFSVDWSVLQANNKKKR